MILGRLANLRREEAVLPEKIRDGLRFLQTHDLASLPAGRIEIDDAMFAVVQDYTTAPKATRRPEFHERHIDIQYIVAGREVIGVAPRSGDVRIVEDHLATRDVAFVEEISEETDITVWAGGFAVFFPWDIHRPQCFAAAAEPVRKVVIKIDVRACRLG
ncbi:YhcH/YjgK/YiaL family protein [Consotaella salsifontis]|uniref:YhcH/YjgK/YiaL family protein n=1 Tax=Consotaella salsifontis TaxID=1365950 RepID=A0A1T4S2A9_9HYPH|nr:YhcH/YjgK/YiaL family protein [Consotaella salsifontis]SKA22429.1 YhcH/YjgK/YiaL family protein [Consotaella salsifontis]